MAVFALVAVGVGVILIAQITRLSVEERRRETAIAAASGASPLSTVAGFIAEAAVLGGAGSALGTLTGIVIARPVVASASADRAVPRRHRPGCAGCANPVGGKGNRRAARRSCRHRPQPVGIENAIAAELSRRAGHDNSATRRLWAKTMALLAVGISGVVAARAATSSGGLEPWQASMANAGVVIAIVGSLLSAAYLSAQAIAVLRFRPGRMRRATLATALTALRADRAARRPDTDDRDRGRRRRPRRGTALGLHHRDLPRRGGCRTGAGQ